MGTIDNQIGDAVLDNKGRTTSESRDTQAFIAEAVAAGGIMNLIKSLPLIINTFAKAFKEYGKGMAEEVTRTSKNLPMKAVLIGVVIIAIALWLLPDVPVNLLGAI